MNGKRVSYLKAMQHCLGILFWISIIGEIKSACGWFFLNCQKALPDVSGIEIETLEYVSRL